MSPQKNNPKLRRVAIVEDDSGLREQLERILKSAPGVSCAGTFGSGEKALEGMVAVQPDVILMDINLPGMSGIEAMNILRKDQATMYIPIIALSANAMLQDIEIGKEAGFFSYLTKPIKIKEFMNALNSALEFAETGNGQSK